MENDKVLSVLTMNHCVFDEISFRRKGFQTDNPAEFSLGVSIRNNSESDYRVSLQVTGDKKEEYELVIRITGFFSFSSDIGEESKNTLLRKNAVAILLPYVRSEIALLTAQPETKCETLPIINVYELLKEPAFEPEE